MANISSLAVKVSANADAFVDTMDKVEKKTKQAGKATKDFANDGLEKAKKRSEETQKTLRSLRNFFVGLGAGAVSAAAGLIAFGLHSLEGVANSHRLARSLGATTEGFTTLAYVASRSGTSADVMAESLRRLNDALSDAKNGSNFAARTFDTLGLSATDLANLPVDKAFQRVAARLAEIPNPATKAAYAYRIFGDKAAALLPLLIRGGPLTGKLAEEARRLGIAVDTVDGKKAEEADAIYKRFGDTLTGIGTQVAVSLTPYLIKLEEVIKSVGKTGQNTGTTITGGFVAVSTVVAGVWDFVVGFWSVLKLIFVGAEAVLLQFVKVALTALRFLAKLPDSLGGSEIKGALKEFELYNGAIWEQVMEDAKAGTDALLGPGASSKLKDLIDKVKDPKNPFSKIDPQAAKDADNLSKTLGELAKKQKLFEEGKGIENSLQSPFQKYGEEITKLDRLLSAGAIQWDTYAKGVSRAVDELENAHKLSEVRLPGAVTKGSGQAISAINQSQALENQRFRESPQQRLQRLAEQSQEIERQQLQQQKRIADALTGKPEPIEVRF